jgi:hypothetical protein
MAGEQRPDGPIVLHQHLLPPRVAERGRTNGGVDDVGEEDRRENSLAGTARDGARGEALGFVQDAIGVTRKERMIESGKLDEARIGDVLDEIPSVANGHDSIVGAIEKQRWSLDGG